MTTPTLVLADLRGFADAVGQFLAALTDLQWGVLLLALGLYGVTLTLRSRAALNIIRAAYPGVPIRWRHIWGAYAAAYGANAVLPARPGDLVRLFLVHRSVPGSSYPTVAS